MVKMRNPWLYLTLLWRSVAYFTKEVTSRLAKRPLVFNGRLANRGLTSLAKEVTGVLRVSVLYICTFYTFAYQVGYHYATKLECVPYIHQPNIYIDGDKWALYCRGLFQIQFIIWMYVCDSLNLFLWVQLTALVQIILRRWTCDHNPHHNPNVILFRLGTHIWFARAQINDIIYTCFLWVFDWVIMNCVRFINYAGKAKLLLFPYFYHDGELKHNCFLCNKKSKIRKNQCNQVLINHIWEPND